jgi:WD40 repeat protein
MPAFIRIGLRRAERRRGPMLRRSILMPFSLMPCRISLRRVLLAIIPGTACLLALPDGRSAETTPPAGQLLRLEGQPGGVFAVVFLPDGKHILSAGGGYRAGRPNGCDLRLWDAKTGKEVRRFEGHMGPVLAAAVSPDGQSILSGSADCTAQLWECSTGKELARFRHQAAIRSVAIAPDGLSILTGSSDGTTRRWETASGQMMQIYDRDRTRAVHCAVFSPDGRHVVTGGFGRSIRVWETETARMEAHCDTTATVLHLVVAPDNLGLVSADSEGGVWLWPIRGGDPVRGYSRATRAASAVAISSDGKQVAAGMRDGTVRVWDRESGKEKARFEGHVGTVSTVAFAPDGRTLASGGEDGSVRVWQISREVAKPKTAGE